MTENLIIFNARVVTPIGFSARCGKEMGELCIIDNATIEVTDGIISYVGPSRGEMRDGYYQRYWHYNARGKCLLPGFVDSHTHFVFGGERAEEFSWRLKGESYMSIMERGGGIVSTVKATRECSFIQLRSKAEGFLKQMSNMGVTTVEGKSGYGLDKETELLQLKVMRSLNNDEHKRVDIVSTFLGAHAVPEEYKGRTDEYLDFIISDVLPCVAKNELAEFCDVFCEQGVFSVEQSRRLLQAAKEYGLGLKLHADEIVPLGGAELAAELSAVSADHLLHASDTGIRAMRDAGTVATLLPLTAFALKEPYARGREMIDSGCAVALATDLNPGSFIQLRSKAEGFLKQMSNMGVTTVEGKSGYGLDKETELLQLKVMRSLNNDEHKRVDIVSTFLGAHAVPEEYKGRTDEYLDFIISDVLPCVAKNELAEFCDVFCEQGVFSVEQSRRLLQAAKEYGLGLKLHADEIVPLGGAELAAELSAVSADHLLHASDTGIRAMRDAGTVATLLPLTAFALKEPYARGREMIDSGCAVALATDLNPGSCFSGSIPLTFALACIYMHLTIEEAITALTLNGAAALNRADSIGSIEVGKKGDFVVLNSDNYHFLPYYVGMNCVNTTIKEGVIYPVL